METPSLTDISSTGSVVSLFQKNAFAVLPAAARFCLENDRGYSASQIAHMLGHRILNDYVSILQDNL